MEDRGYTKANDGRRNFRHGSTIGVLLKAKNIDRDPLPRFFMSRSEPHTLEKFHRFIGEQLQSETAAQMSPEQALALWRERQECVQAIQQGLADVEAGRTKPLDEFLADFQARHGIVGE